MLDSNSHPSAELDQRPAEAGFGADTVAVTVYVECVAKPTCSSVGIENLAGLQKVHA